MLRNFSESRADEQDTVSDDLIGWQVLVLRQRNSTRFHSKTQTIFQRNMQPTLQEEDETAEN